MSVTRLMSRVGGAAGGVAGVGGDRAGHAHRGVAREAREAIEAGQRNRDRHLLNTRGHLDPVMNFDC